MLTLRLVRYCYTFRLLTCSTSLASHCTLLLLFKSPPARAAVKNSRGRSAAEDV